MMKLEHLNEAVKLWKNLKAIEEQLAALNETKDIQINWCSRSVIVKQDDPKFEDLRSAMRVILENQHANLVRRCNQIDLLVDPVCIKS